MSEDEGHLLSTNKGDASDIKVQWRNVTTILADSVVGFVNVANVPRVTLGQVVYSPTGMPNYLPVVTIAAPAEALRFMAAQFVEIANQIEGVDEHNEQSAG